MGAHQLDNSVTRGSKWLIAAVIALFGLIGVGGFYVVRQEQLAAAQEARQQMAILQEGRDRSDQIEETRRRFHVLQNRVTNQHRKMNRLLLRIIQRSQRGEEILITREEVQELFNGPQQGELEDGDAGGNGDTGGQPPPPPAENDDPLPLPIPSLPPLPTVGQGNAQVCPPRNPHCGGGG